jgi:mono/diheme cytochrome c family protein
MKPFAATIVALVILVAIAVLGTCAFVYSGLYNIGADDHHTAAVHALLRTLRERSIEVRAKDIVVPDLNDPQRILTGAGHYAAMCTGCHLAPGRRDSEIRPGLYPQPPNLSKSKVDPRAAFWVIKHGIKMSAMPAWGSSHDDATIWNMVAFVQRLPTLTPAQYKDIVAKAPPDDDMDMDEGDAHSHDHGAGAGHDAAMPGMDMPAAPHGAAAPGQHDDSDHHDDKQGHDHGAAAAAGH